MCMTYEPVSGVVDFSEMAAIHEKNIAMKKQFHIGCHSHYSGKQQLPVSMFSTYFDYCHWLLYGVWSFCKDENKNGKSFLAISFHSIWSLFPCGALERYSMYIVQKMLNGKRTAQVVVMVIFLSFIAFKKHKNLWVIYRFLSFLVILFM